MINQDKRQYAKVFAAACLALGHTTLAVLAATGHLGITIPSAYWFITLLGTNFIWLFIHVICASLIVVSLVTDKWHVQTLSVSSGFMGTWGFFSLLGALTAVSPVSFAGPMLAIVLAGVAHALALSWAVDPNRVKN